MLRRAAEAAAFLRTPAARRPYPAHDLRHDPDGGVVPNGGGVGREDAVLRREAALLGGVAHECTEHPQTVPGRALDVICALDEEAVNRRADRPVAEQADSDVASQLGPPPAPVA